MPRGRPDWSEWSNAPNETPISVLDSANIGSTTYATLATYTVPAGAEFILYGVEMSTNDFSVSFFRLTIGGTVQWTDKDIPVSLNVFFAAARLAAGTVVLLEGRTDGTDARLFGAIEGKELRSV